MVSAIVMISVESARIPEVGQAVADVDGVKTVYSVTGGVDLVAIVAVRDYEDLAPVISDRINKVPGVKETTTHLAFRTYSNSDLDAGFDLGLGD